MFDELIDTSSRHVFTACEQTRRMDGMVTRNSRYTHTGQSIAMLVESLDRIENNGVINLQAAGQALLQAERMLASGSFGGSVARTVRSLNGIANGFGLMARSGNNIRQGVIGISGGDPQSIISNAGIALNNEINSTGQIFGNMRRIFDAAFNADFQDPLNGIELTTLLPGDLLSGFSGALPAAGASHAHLLVLTASGGESFYFNLSTAGYDTLRRQTNYNVVAQDRLTRTNALQAVSKGGETITLSGAIFTSRSGSGQLDKLRNIGYEMLPLNLTTGYGETLGRWYLTRVEEEQTGLFSDGMARKQQFTLEFSRYGEDYQNI